MSHEHLRPPEELSSVGGGGRGYEAVGKRWRDMLTSPPEGLAPNERVLDAGCGVGRIAVPLTGYMSSEGSYEGFDIEPQAITWCRENITPSYPNFQFQVADIYNKRYNPGGTQQPYEYRFPYPDDSFDFAFLASVFTHLLPDAVDNYLSEISRVLRSGGRCAISYFLLNEVSQDYIRSGKIKKGPRFAHDFGTYRVRDREVPEAAVAHNEQVVRRLYEQNGLRILEPIQHGSWAGRKGSMTRQDIIWAVKE